MDKLNQKVLDEYVKQLEQVKYKNKILALKLEHCVDENNEDYINLGLITVKKSQRKKGYGSAIMDDIVQLADIYNLKVKLWVTDVFGTQLRVLYEFYKKHGFVLIKEDNDGYMVYYPNNKK